MMNVTIKKSGSERTIHFEGDLTIENAGKIHEALLKPFDKEEHRIISVEKAGAIDLSCLQLFCSAHRAAVAESALLSIDANRSEEFRKKTREAGFLRREPCLATMDKDCLWTEDQHG